MCGFWHAREGEWVKASRAWPVPPWGLCAALLPAPPPRCVHGGLWPCTGAMLALSKNMFYTAQTCHLILFFFLSFCWQNFVGQKTCSLFPQDWGVFKHFSPWDIFKTSLKYFTKSSLEFFENVFAETFVLYMSIITFFNTELINQLFSNIFLFIPVHFYVVFCSCYNQDILIHMSNFVKIRNPI